MNERIEKLSNLIKNKGQVEYREPRQINLTDEFVGMSYIKRVTHRFKRLLELEEVVFLPDERIAFLRSTPEVPAVYSPEELTHLRQGHYSHELGRVFNITSDFPSLLQEGLLGRRAKALVSLDKYADNNQKVDFLSCAIESIDAVLDLAGRYAHKAYAQGLTEIAANLERVPAHGAETFLQALQSIRIVHASLYLAGHYHCGLGRFDQYMWPYLKNDMDKGILDEAEAEELLEEFFISLNRDTDLYPGVQQGDNGQSLMLGGCDREGNDAVNPFTYMCLRASRDLKLIDPKINLRVSSKTDIELYQKATELTAQHLGFPQYSNDDVVIPGLTAKRYDLQDARNYTVAACWEYIIPAVGMDIPNIAAVSLAQATDAAIRTGLRNNKKFDEILVLVKDEIQSQVDNKCREVENIIIEPAPYHSALMCGCLEKGCDIAQGAKYNNYGFHGTGLANAVDQLAAVKKTVFDEGRLSTEGFLQALESDFQGCEDMRFDIINSSVRMGHNDETTDTLAQDLCNMFIDSLRGKTNERGGCIRAGFGSAMYYLTHGEELGATADGRKIAQPVSANLSPSLETHSKGPVSVIKSFAKLNYLDAPNGGPLTLEFDDTVFRNEDGKKKVAQFVKSYIDMGGQQLQLNAVDKDTLLDAQIHPEFHKNLVVRVWGWSGYFCELEKPYQDHIIARTAH